jgi:hypothetical protein
LATVSVVLALRVDRTAAAPLGIRRGAARDTWAAAAREGVAVLTKRAALVTGALATGARGHGVIAFATGAIAVRGARAEASFAVASVFAAQTRFAGGTVLFRVELGIVAGSRERRVTVIALLDGEHAESPALVEVLRHTRRTLRRFHADEAVGA